MMSGVHMRIVVCIVVAINMFVLAPHLEAQQDVIAEDLHGDRVDLIALRAAIKDQIREYPDHLSCGEGFLSRLERLESRMRTGDNVVSELRELQLEALIANPLIAGNPILYVARPQYKNDHHNTETLFQTDEINTSSFEGGGALKSIDFGDGGKVKTLITIKEGMVRDPEIHFDGEKILFSMRRNIADDYHLYEINNDGTRLCQLTFAPHVSDVDPFYLPDGNIVFSSTREPKYCMCNRHIMANLYRMEANGANIHQIGKNTLFEGHGTLTPSGSILYYRWEYVDRNFGDAQALWTVNSDGTNHAVFWGNNTSSPGGVINPRYIPGTQQVLCVFVACHDRPWGALAIIDRRLGLDGKSSVVRTWPPDALELVDTGDFDTFKKIELKYEDPFPLSEKYFLCSRMTGRGEQTAMYLVDTFGNEIRLHADKPGVFDPMPIRVTKRPASLPTLRDYENKNGFFFVSNVYDGTHMEGVQAGSVKALRVVEVPEKRTWTIPSWNGQGQEAPAMNWHDFNSKRILGMVPVYSDGSAYFEVPSETFVYFQLLDENGMMVQSMRSGVIVQSGETLSCVGCHEDRLKAPAFHGKNYMSEALAYPPARLEGWHGEPRLFSYAEEVQPVFDKHCVQCHDYGNSQGNLNLSGDRSMTFNTSYSELWRKGLISVTGAGPAEIQQARSWGSHASKLVHEMVQEHHGVKLSKEDLDRIVTWVDINAPYYPVYESAYPDNLAGRSPLDGKQLARLEKITGVPFAQLADCRTSLGPQVNFDRPEFSTCLQHIPEDKAQAREEALAILREGSLSLSVKPRADMNGFSPSAADEKRLQKYEQRRKLELANRKAIREGGKMYDEK